MDYSVGLSIEGGDWITIAGTVATESSLEVKVVTAKTVLVDGDCSDDSSGPGC